MELSSFGLWWEFALLEPEDWMRDNECTAHSPGGGARRRKHSRRVGVQVQPSIHPSANARAVPRFGARPKSQGWVGRDSDCWSSVKTDTYRI